MAIVTLTDMKIALSKTLGKQMSDEALDALAEHVMSFFGFREVIIDNKLTAKDRDLFYQMENVGLLKTDNEEATLKKGKRWRIHYWVLNTEYVMELSEGREKKDKAGAYDIYDDEDMWDRTGDKKSDEE